MTAEQEQALRQRFPILRFFAWDHLSEPLRQTSFLFADTAHQFASGVPIEPEPVAPDAHAIADRDVLLVYHEAVKAHRQRTGARMAEATVALRKLLEAKDAAVRAMLP